MRDVGRVDKYPSVDSEKGISPWFRVGLVDTYHRGIQVVLSWETLCWDEATKQWKYTDHKANQTPDITAALVGQIRYENIASVNWDGDEYYGFPHIYCHFVEKKGQPYERVVFCERVETERGEFYRELADFDDVKTPRR